MLGVKNDGMSNSQRKLVDISIELEEMNMTLKEQFSFVKNLKRVARKNET